MVQDASSSDSHFDLVVIGGGTIGLAAAYYAAVRGLKTVLLEQYEQFADPHASSGGVSRMFRIMYSPEYMARLAENAFPLWREIEAASKTKILFRRPLLFYGLSRDTVEGDLGKMRQILDQLGAPYRWFGSGQDLARAFSVFKSVPDEYVGLEQPNSAVIRTQHSIKAFHDLSKEKGATLLTNQVATISIKKRHYEVTCPAGTYRAPKLILAPSAWTNQVLRPFGIELNLSIWQMTVAHFKVDRPDYPLWYEFGPTSHSLADRMYISNTHPGDPTTQLLFYGFPPDESFPGCIKASVDITPKTTFKDPKCCTYKPDEAILHKLGCFLKERFNGVKYDQPIEPSTCLYTMSHDYQMILDTLPGYPNVAIFTGDSGRGFKFTPLFGRILVDLATVGDTTYDISPFSIRRSGIIENRRAPCILHRMFSRESR